MAQPIIPDSSSGKFAVIEHNDQRPGQFFTEWVTEEEAHAERARLQPLYPHVSFEIAYRPTADEKARWDAECARVDAFNLEYWCVEIRDTGAVSDMFETEAQADDLADQLVEHFEHVVVRHGTWFYHPDRPEDVEKRAKMLAMLRRVS